MSSPPQQYPDLRGLEQTIPPPRPQRVPSPALRDDPSAYVPMPEPERYARQGRRTPSPSGYQLQPATYQPPKLSAWENRGHRSPPNAATQAFPRERSARSVSPQMRTEPAVRARTPPALEPAPLDVSRKRTGPRSARERQLQPSDAELRREREQQQAQAHAHHRRNRSSPAATPSQQPQRKSPSPGPSSRRTPSPGPSAPPPPQHRLNTAAVRRPSQESISPLSASTMQVSPITPHARTPSAGEANLAKIGAPRQPRKKPRAAVPSMCDYLSMDELEGLWAQQDQFVGSVTAPQGRAGQAEGSASGGRAIDKVLEARGLTASAVPPPPVEELGVHPAFRGEQGPMAMAI